MSLQQYFNKKVRVTFVDGQVLEGSCNGFTSKEDTAGELYDEITIRTSEHPYVGFNESEIKTIEEINE